MGFAHCYWPAPIELVRNSKSCIASKTSTARNFQVLQKIWHWQKHSCNIGKRKNIGALCGISLLQFLRKSHWNKRNVVHAGLLDLDKLDLGCRRDETRRKEHSIND